MFPIQCTVRDQCLKCPENLRNEVFFIKVVFVIHKTIDDLTSRTVVV